MIFYFFEGLFSLVLPCLGLFGTLSNTFNGLSGELYMTERKLFPAALTIGPLTINPISKNRRLRARRCHITMFRWERKCKNAHIFEKETVQNIITKVQ